MQNQINEVIKRINDWKRKKVKFTELGGGITNHNYLAEVNGNRYVVRIPGEKTDIFIDRENELNCSIEAGKTGIAPEVVYYLKPENISVIEFINGKTLKQEDIVGHPDIIKKIVKAIRKIHDNAVFKCRFDPFDTIRAYTNYVNKYDAFMPDDIKYLFKETAEIERVIKSKPESLKACHNDLLSENFLFDGDRVWIIDWEYGGMGDPYFDLGDFAVEHKFSEEEEKSIISYYCGKYDERGYAKLFVYKIVSDLWWGIWAMIQARISSIDFDYYNYGLNRFNRMRKNIHSATYKESMLKL